MTTPKMPEPKGTDGNGKTIKPRRCKNCGKFPGLESDKKCQYCGVDNLYFFTKTNARCL